MARLYDLVRVQTSTTGSGPVTLGDAVAGHLTFAQAGVLNGDTVSYSIIDGDSTEVGRGVYNSSAGTLTRSVLKSTNSNQALSLSGSAEVMVAFLAEDLIFNDPDTPPASPTVYDDEFNGASLDAKWTKSSTAGADDVNATWPGSVCITLNNSNQTYEIAEDYAPAGDFSVTCCAFIFPTDNYHAASISVRTADGNDEVMLGHGFSSPVSTASSIAYLHHKNGGSWSYNVAFILMYRVSKVYLHLQRVGTEFSLWISTDGRAYTRITTLTKTMTVAKLVLSAGIGTTTKPIRAGFDWVRVNWMTL